MGKHRKVVSKGRWQAKWHDGRCWHMTQGHGEKKKQRLQMTLNALPWVDSKSIQVQQVG